MNQVNPYEPGRGIVDSACHQCIWNRRPFLCTYLAMVFGNLVGMAPYYANPWFSIRHKLISVCTAPVFLCEYIRMAYPVFINEPSRIAVWYCAIAAAQIVLLLFAIFSCYAKSRVCCLLVGIFTFVIAFWFSITDYRPVP